MPYRLDCIVMDTETTGFRVDEGHRLIEVATVEVEDAILPRRARSVTPTSHP
jgi:DNA polymerase III epsilon subunit-like protein